jgi:toxin FitB
MRWLVDTNVISDIRKPKASERVREWMASADPFDLYTSDVNMAELVYGAGKADNIIRQNEILDWIESTVRPIFVGRILSINEDIFVRWRVLMRQLNKSGTPAPAVDLLVAAAAIQMDLGVATRDVAPFVATGVPVLNPFTGDRYNGA